MKRIATLLTLPAMLFLNNSLYAQVGLCAPSSAAAQLDINNVNATILNGGDMWRDHNFNAGYEVPKGSGNHTFYTQGLWLGGQQINSGSLSSAGVMYRSSGNDFYPGPLDHSGNIMDSMCLAFDGIFTMTKAEVDSQIAGLSIPYNVLIWPGKGNPHTGIPTQDLAPFVDVDGDGIYNPYQGDYPKIKGDKALWYVFNDAGNVHTETQGDQIGAEVHVMAYAYTGSGHEDNSTFYDYTIINKRQSMTNFYMSLFTDVDLGDSMDDFIGCDSTRGLGYVYNSTASDLHYGTNPPAAGIRAVVNPQINNNQPMEMSKFMYFNNSFGAQGSPSINIEFFNYMRGYWRDASPLYTGGSGHVLHPQADTANPTNFVFAGMPGNAGEWSECEAGMIGSDRRMLMSYGPMDFMVGDTLRFTSAGLYARNLIAPTGCGNQVQSLLDVSDDVHAYHDSITDCSLFNPLYQIAFTHPDAGMSNGTIEVSYQGDTPSSLWSTGDVNQNTLIGLDTGLYKLVMHNGKNCYNVVDVVLEEPSGTTDFAEEGFRIYPNPTSERVFVEISNTEQQTTVALLDLTGKTLIEKVVLNRGEFSTEKLEQGIYLIRVSTEETTLTKRLLVVH